MAGLLDDGSRNVTYKEVIAPGIPLYLEPFVDQNGEPTGNYLVTQNGEPIFKATDERIHCWFVLDRDASAALDEDQHNMAERQKIWMLDEDDEETIPRDERFSMLDINKLKTLMTEKGRPVIVASYDTLWMAVVLLPDGARPLPESATIQ